MDNLPCLHNLCSILGSRRKLVWFPGPRRDLNNSRGDLQTFKSSPTKTGSLMKARCTKNEKLRMLTIRGCASFGKLCTGPALKVSLPKSRTTTSSIGDRHARANPDQHHVPIDQVLSSRLTKPLRMNLQLHPGKFRALCQIYCRLNGLPSHDHKASIDVIGQRRKPESSCLALSTKPESSCLALSTSLPLCYGCQLVVRCGIPQLVLYHDAWFGIEIAML